MKPIIDTAQLRLACLAFAALSLGACGQTDAPAPAAETAATEAPAAVPAQEKMPITTVSDEARTLYLEGRALADNLHAVEAREKFVAAIEADPDFALAYQGMAFSSQTTAQFFDAVGKAEDSMSAASEGEQLLIKALIAGAENDQDAQREALSNLMSMYPKDERSHMAMANFLNGLQDFDGAVLHFGHAASINPEFAAAFNSLGYAHRSNGNLDGAKEAFQRYVELIPDEANPYDSYAELLMEMGQHDESIDNYRKAIELDPNFISAYAGISINESLRGDAEAAQQAAMDMLAIARTSGQKQNAMFRSVTAHLMAGDSEAALAKAEEMIAKSGEQENHAAMGGMSEYMGDIIMSLGDGAKATEYYESALQHRQQANTNEATKMAAERAYQFKTAIAAMVDDEAEVAAERTAKYTAAAGADGNAFERRRIHELAGFLAMMNEDNETAAAEFAQASQLNPIVLYWSAVVNKELGNSEKAADLAHRAAHRNTLSGNLPFFRSEAVELAEELAAM